MKRLALAAGPAMAIAALLSVLHGQQPAGSAAAWAPTVAPIASPAGTGTTEPQLTTEGNRTILSWLELREEHTALKFAERTRAGWSAVQTAAEGDEFMVNPADVPAVRALADGTLAAQWLQQDGDDDEAYTLQLSWSSNGGRTWSTPVTPHHGTAHVQHGFASLFQVPGAGLGLVWLDGRGIKPGAPPGSGSMSLRSAIFEPGGKQRNEGAVDARVCDCCPTASAATSEGVIVAYRNRTENEIRDIYVTRLVDGRWTPPTAVHNDGWRIEACPINGPAVAARGRDVVVAWFTAKGGQGHAFVAFSHDAGRTFGQPVRVDEASSLGRVDVELLPDGSAVVSWVEFSSEHSTFRVRRVDSTGARGRAISIADSGGTRFPRLAAAGSELLFAWSEGDGETSRVRTARALLPPAVTARR